MGEGKTWAAHSELHFIEHLRFFVLMICGHGLRLRFSTSGHVSNYIPMISNEQVGIPAGGPRQFLYTATDKDFN